MKYKSKLLLLIIAILVCLGGLISVAVKFMASSSTHHWNSYLEDMGVNSTEGLILFVYGHECDSVLESFKLVGDKYQGSKSKIYLVFLERHEAVAKRIVARNNLKYNVIIDNDFKAVRSGLIEPYSQVVYFDYGKNKFRTITIESFIN